MYDRDADKAVTDVYLRDGVHLRIWSITTLSHTFSYTEGNISGLCKGGDFRLETLNRSRKSQYNENVLITEAFSPHLSKVGISFVIYSS